MWSQYRCLGLSPIVATIHILLECSDVHLKAEQSDITSCAARCMLAEPPVAQSLYTIPLKLAPFPLVWLHPGDVVHLKRFNLSQARCP